MTKDAKRLFNTLTRAQQKTWAEVVRTGFEPVIIPDPKNKKKKILRRITCAHTKCGKNALVFKKCKTVLALCSSNHSTYLVKK
jgi:hypothetical protein